MKRNKGITLIALVITIIVLIILAGVSINLVLGQNGIFNRAKQGAKDYKIASIEEKVRQEILDLSADKLLEGERLTVEEALTGLEKRGTFEEIDLEEEIGIAEGYIVELGYDEDENVIILGIEKDTGRRIIAKVSPEGYTKDSVTVAISIKINGEIVNNATIEIPEGMVKQADRTYKVSKNGTYLVKATPEEGEPIQKEIKVTTIDTKAPVNFTITAKVEQNGDVTITNTAHDAETDETTACSGIGKIEYYLQKEGETAFNKIETNKSEENPYEENGVIHNLPTGNHKIYAIAIDKVGNQSNQTEEIEVTIKRIVPPAIGTTGTTHTADELIFDWEELEQIAELISDNYGEKTGKINSDTAEIAVSINGKSQTIGIGDTKTVNEKQVRILGFNHDDLTNQDTEGNYLNAYGEGKNNTKAGISFEFVDCLLDGVRVYSSNSNENGWAACELRENLNNLTINTLENKEQIKKVKKDYLKTYDNINTMDKSNDYLWLLSLR